LHAFVIVAAKPRRDLPGSPAVLRVPAFLFDAFAKPVHIFAQHAFVENDG
jgi:hypothetical protein